MEDYGCDHSEIMEILSSLLATKVIAHNIENEKD